MSKPYGIVSIIDIDEHIEGILDGIKTGVLPQACNVFNSRTLEPLGLYFQYAQGMDVSMLVLDKDGYGLYECNGFDIARIPIIIGEDQYFQLSLIHDLPFSYESSKILNEIINLLPEFFDAWVKDNA